MNERPAPPRRGPAPPARGPLPPARRPEAPAQAAPQPPPNPFMPAPEPAPPANPFLADAGPSDGQVVTSAANVLSSNDPVAQPAPTPAPTRAEPEPAPPRAAQPGAVPAPVAAPLQVQPGALTPQVRDPHAAFRKGGAHRPALFAGLGAVVLGGLFFLIPSGKEAPTTPTDSTPVIGASVSPEIIEDPDSPVQNPTATEARATAQPAPAAPPSNGSSESSSAEFAQAFRSSGQH